MVCEFAKAICALLCCPPVPSRIASKLMFGPPMPAYDFLPAQPDDEAEGGEGGGGGGGAGGDQGAAGAG
eukprot:SAG22_NODE_9428_length_590_cov_0.859470_1_plen_68_part_01